MSKDTGIPLEGIIQQLYENTAKKQAKK